MSNSNYTAHFQPESWVNDYAICCDSEGEQEWDVTGFMIDPPGYLSDTVAELKARVDSEGQATDNADVLRFHPGIPEWAAEWQGPFTITVSRSRA